MGRDPKPRKTKANTPKKTTGGKREKVPFGSARFARIELVEAEKEDFRTLRAGGEFDNPPVQHWLDMGYKLTLSADENGGGVVAVLTPLFMDVENAGLQLSARAATWDGALQVMEYKDFYVAGEDGWAACEQARGGTHSDIA